MTRRKIVLRFIVGADEDNNYRYKNVTLKNIRTELNDQQMCEYVARYCSLTANVLEEAVVIDERRLILEEEVELFEEIPEAKTETEPIELIEKAGDVEKGVTTTSVTRSEVKPKKKAVNKVAHAIQTADDETLKPKLGEKNPTDTKNQEQSEVKKQSPPKETESVVDVSIPNSGICEDEIEIWLEDDQDQSVEALMAIIEKAIESKGVTGMPLKPDTLSLATDSRDPCLPITYEPIAKPFVLPVKKKRMRPPIGKKTKQAKKKRS